MIIEITDGTLKARTGDYVIYRVDYLLKNFDREREILESSQRLKTIPFDRTEFERELQEFKKRINNEPGNNSGID